MIPVFDTNIVIDILKGLPPARSECEIYDKIAISVITWMQVMSIASPEEKNAVETFLSFFEIVEIDTTIARVSITIRKEYPLNAAGALIWATAQTRGTLLITRNSKDFPYSHPGIRMPYRL